MYQIRGRRQGENLGEVHAFAARCVNKVSQPSPYPGRRDCCETHLQYATHTESQRRLKGDGEDHCILRKTSARIV